MVQAADDASSTQPDDASTGRGPYRNLWVPLIVVPFLVVIVLVLVFVFFGAIRGSEASIAENLELVVSGGSNERQQAALSLVAQVLENREAYVDGREPVWPVEGDILVGLQAAWDKLPADDNPWIRLALAQLAASQGDPNGLAKLAGFLELTDSDDPDAKMRAVAMLALSWLADERAAELLSPFLQHEDAFLQQTAAAALQNVPGEASRAALREMLDHPSLELRGQAAISLSHLGDPAGGEVLRELVAPESYARARAQDPRKFAGDRDVHEARLKAVQALGRLGRPEDRTLLEALAAEEGDPAVREAAMLALEAASEPAPVGAGESGDPPRR